MIEALPDVIEPELVLVFCGTAASAVSARAGTYYANPSNAFWPTLHRVGITSRQFAPAEYRDLLPLRIGLTDLAKFSAGVDSTLASDDFGIEALREKIMQSQPQILAFTSKKAWRVCIGNASAAVQYGQQRQRWGPTRLFVLPSPSGAARRYWDLGPWQALAAEYRRLRETA